MWPELYVAWAQSMKGAHYEKIDHGQLGSRDSRIPFETEIATTDSVSNQVGQGNKWSFI